MYEWSFLAKKLTSPADRKYETPLTGNPLVCLIAPKESVWNYPIFFSSERSDYSSEISVEKSEYVLKLSHVVRLKISLKLLDNPDGLYPAKYEIKLGSHTPQRLPSAFESSQLDFLMFLRHRLDIYCNQ